MYTNHFRKKQSAPVLLALPLCVLGTVPVYASDTTLGNLLGSAHDGGFLGRLLGTGQKYYTLATKSSSSVMSSLIVVAMLLLLSLVIGVIAKHGDTGASFSKAYAVMSICFAVTAFARLVALYPTSARLISADTSQAEAAASYRRGSYTYGLEFLTGAAPAELEDKAAYQASYAPTIAAIRSSGTSVLSYDKVTFNLDAPVSPSDVKDGSFLTDPENFTVTKATTVTWTENGQTGTIPGADIADIKALPEDAEILCQPDSGDTSAKAGTPETVSVFLAEYANQG